MGAGDVYERVAGAWVQRATLGAGGRAEQWWSGAGNPSAAIGMDGDWYLDTSSAMVYPPPLVTALPSSPAEGQEVYFQTTAMAAANSIWHLRYRAAVVGANKWELLGGSALYDHNINTSIQQTANISTYAAMTNTPTVTLPLSGDYLVEMTGSIFWGAITYGEARVGVRKGSDSAPLFSAWPVQAPSQTGGMQDIYLKRRFTFTAGDVLTLMVSTSTAVNRNFGHNDGFRLDVLPVRVG